MRELNHLINTGDDNDVDMILHYILSIFAIEVSCAPISSAGSKTNRQREPSSTRLGKFTWKASPLSCNSMEASKNWQKFQ